MIPGFETDHEVRRINDLFGRAIFDRATFADALQALLLDFIHQSNEGVIELRGIDRDLLVLQNNPLGQLITGHQIEIAIVRSRSELSAEP